jgi:transposase-like protein
MSRKVKYTVMAKIEAAERYLRGEASAAEIAVEMKMPKTGEIRILEWAAIYRENGIEGFHLKEGNGSYTAEEKQQAVEEYLQGKGSLREICRKHHIPSSWTLWQWIKRYNLSFQL